MPKGIRIFFLIIVQIGCLIVLSKLLLALGYLFMDELSRAIAQFYPSGGMAASGGNMGGSSGGSGWTSFVGVLEELFPEAEGEQAQNTQDDPTPSALPQAPAPPEVGHPVPNQGEVEELRMQLHAVIQEQIRQE